MLSHHMPDLAALEMLAAVGDLGSLSATGKRLGISQQAVSSRMRALEAQTGFVLLVRTPRGSTLSEKGMLLSGWATEVLAAAHRLDAGIASIRSDILRHLNVVASQTIAEHLLPHWLVALRGQQESLGFIPTAVELRVSNSEAAIAAIRAGQADLGFIETPYVPEGLSHSIVQFDALTVVVAPGHSWARRRTPLTAAELAATPLVARELGSGTRESLTFALAKAGVESAVSPLVELGTTAAIRSAVAAGTAPGVLSGLAVRDDLALHRLVHVPVQGLDLRRSLTAIWKSGKYPPAGPARDLLSVAAEVHPVH